MEEEEEVCGLFLSRIERMISVLCCVEESLRQAAGRAFEEDGYLCKGWMDGWICIGGIAIPAFIHSLYKGDGIGGFI